MTPTRAPAVKGVEQAHDRALFSVGQASTMGLMSTSMRPPPNGVQPHRQHEPGVGVGEQAGEGAHADEPRRGEQVGPPPRRAGSRSCPQSGRRSNPPAAAGRSSPSTSRVIFSRLIDKRPAGRSQTAGGARLLNNGLGDVAQIAGVLGVAVIGADRHRGTSSSKIRNLLY